MGICNGTAVVKVALCQLGGQGEAPLMRQLYYSNSRWLRSPEGPPVTARVFTHSAAQLARHLGGGAQGSPPLFAVASSRWRVRGASLPALDNVWMSFPGGFSAPWLGGAGLVPKRLASI